METNTVVSPLPERKTITPVRWGLWGTFLWGFAIAIVFLFIQLVMVAVSVVASNNTRQPTEELVKQLHSAANSGKVLSYATCATTIICGGLLLGIIKLKKNAVLSEYLCIRKVHLATMARWLGITTCLLITTDIISVLLGRPIVPEVVRISYATANPVWIIWLAIVFMGPLFEELFFRGFLLGGLEASALRPVGAVFLTSVLWASLHVQYEAYIIVSIFCDGILLGLARLGTNSIITPLVMHIFTNLLATIEAAIYSH